MSEKDKANLLAIVDSCIKIQNFVEEILDADAFYKDDKTFDAVLMNFMVIGESVARLSKDLKIDQLQIPWTKIKEFRNIAAHDYFSVDAEEVWQTIKNNIPDLKNKVEEILKDK